MLIHDARAVQLISALFPMSDGRGRFWCQLRASDDVLFPRLTSAANPGNAPELTERELRCQKLADH